MEDATRGLPPPVNGAQLATAQKLLLFWRKPAVCRLPSLLCCTIAHIRFDTHIEEVLVGCFGRRDPWGRWYVKANTQSLGEEDMDLGDGQSILVMGSLRD